MSKPVLRRRYGCWFCHGNGRTGQAQTPHGAYAMWIRTAGRGPMYYTQPFDV